MSNLHVMDRRFSPNVGRGCGCAAKPSRMRDSGERVPRRSRGVEPVVLIGSPGTKCGPFLRVEKDPEKFAACNALADEVGPLDTPKKSFRLIEEAIGDELNEVFGVMTLDIHYRMKGISNTGRGESASVAAPLQSTLRTALASGGDYAIIYHVHPSGIEAQPSDADKETTAAFVEAFEAIGMPLLDHMIVGGDVRRRSYYSFLEDNAL